MRRIFSLFAAVCMLAILGVTAARAQETAIKISVKDPTFRAEVGTSILNVDDVLGIPAADFRIWAGAGTTIGDDGRLSGSAAALWRVPKAGKGLKAEIGPEYRSIEKDRPRFDLVAQFGLDSSTSAAFSMGERGRLGFFYSRRF